tara:strand:- start:2622 stop:2867 length:246 start_codon:yes stop_codon:yes gene_type:complete
MKYLSKNLLIIGTKKIINRKTKGQDLIIEPNQTIKNSLKSSREKKIVTPETVVLVQKDIIKANKQSLILFEITYIKLRNTI